MKFIRQLVYSIPFPLVLIFVLGLALRFYRLADIPYGLHEDEMMNGYVGRFILENGKDLYGNTWPILYFDNFGDFPNVIPMYLSGLFTYVFGVTVFAVRFPIALVGSLTIIPVFYILRQVFLSRSLALFGSFLLAISPWHIVLSRSTAENVTATFVYTIAICIFLQYKKDPRLKWLASIVSLLVLTYFLYPGYRLVSACTPLLFAFSVSRVRKERLLFIGISALMLMLTFMITRTTWGKGRADQTSIFSFNDSVHGRLVNMTLTEGPGQVLRARVFHNKLVGYTREFLHQYVSYFSFDTLFAVGGKPMRYFVEDSGLFPYTYLLVLTSGAYILIFQRRMPDNVFTAHGDRVLLFSLLLLCTSILPAALTLDDVPNVHRALGMSIWVLFPVTYFFSRVSSHAFGRYLQLGFIVLLTVESVYFTHQFFIHGKTAQTVFREDARTTLAQYLIENESKYEEIIIPQDAKPLYYLFYSNNFSPELAGKFKENIKIDRMNTIQVIDNNCPGLHKELVLKRGMLIVQRSECLENGKLHKIAEIKRSNDTDAFFIYIPEPTQL